MADIYLFASEIAVISTEFPSPIQLPSQEAELPVGCKSTGDLPFMA